VPQQEAEDYRNNCEGRKQERERRTVFEQIRVPYARRVQVSVVQESVGRRAENLEVVTVLVRDLDRNDDGRRDPENRKHMRDLSHATGLMRILGPFGLMNGRRLAPGWQRHAVECGWPAA